VLVECLQQFQSLGMEGVDRNFFVLVGKVNLQKREQNNLGGYNVTLSSTPIRCVSMMLSCKCKVDF